MRAPLALAVALAACGASRAESTRAEPAYPGPVESADRDTGEGRVEWVDGCDENGHRRDVGPRPTGDRVRMITTCAGERVCDPGPRARLRDKLACGVQFEHRPGTRGRYRRATPLRPRIEIRRARPPAAPPPSE